MSTGTVNVNATATYKLLVVMAQELSENIREKKPARWISHGDLVRALKDVGLRETDRTIITKVLKPIQLACIEANLPDLSAIIVKKTRGDFGSLISPASSWWDPYVERAVCEANNIGFWFVEFRRARDFTAWPEQSPV